MTDTKEDKTENDDLGCVIYSERMHITPAVTYTLLGCGFLILGVLGSFLKNPNPRGQQNLMVVLGVVIAMGGGLCLTIGLVRLIPNLGAAWHLHQHGVRLVKRGKELILRYEEIDELTSKVVRVFFHSACTGEVHEVTLKPHAPHKSAIYVKQVRRTSKMSGADLNQPSELAKVCDHIAALIANRMADSMQHGETIEWVRTLRIRSGGLELGSPRTKADWIEWNQIDKLGIEEGMFQLWRHGDPQPLVKLPTHLPNFFPGYLLIERAIRGHSRGHST